MIAAGFGFRRGTTVESLLDAYAKATAGLKPDVIATVTGKADTAAFQELAMRLQLPLDRISKTRLGATVTITHSRQSLDTHGTGSVAEAAALAAIGRDAELIGARAVSDDRMATCACAREARE